MTGRLRAVVDWIEQRTGLVSAIGETMAHRVPRDSASWWYVFGSASLEVFMLQVVTGICLALVYAPSANDAWGSLIALDYEIPLGWFLRALRLGLELHGGAGRRPPDPGGAVRRVQVSASR